MNEKILVVDDEHDIADFPSARKSGKNTHTPLSC